jgi:hypothetical protein
MALMRQNCIGKAAAFLSIHRNGIAGEFVMNKTLRSIKLLEPFAAQPDPALEPT